MNAFLNHSSCRRFCTGMTRLGLPAGLTGVLILLAACASEPSITEPAAASATAVSAAAVVQAGSAGGGELAPVEMRMAREKLDRANLAMTTKDYGKAQSLAQEALADARLAEVKSRSSKARKAADELEEASRVLSEEMNRKSN
jgi:hypothetical protein